MAASSVSLNHDYYHQQLQLRVHYAQQAVMTLALEEEVDV